MLKQSNKADIEGEIPVLLVASGKGSSAHTIMDPCSWPELETLILLYFISLVPGVCIK